MNKKRTSGYRSQNEFDNLLADLDGSSLRFLSSKYNKDLVYFKVHHNINEQENAQEYKEIQQRKKMIEQELGNRKKYGTLIGITQDFKFDSETGFVTDLDNHIVQQLAYNETETEIISLPSGTKGKIENTWENLTDTLDDEPDFDYALKNEVELSWMEWCDKKRLILPNEKM